MASLDNPASELKNVTPRPSRVIYFRIDIALRILLFVFSFVAILLIVTSKQTNLFPVPGTTFSVKIPAKFTYFPAFIYLFVALLVACLYSFITALTSLSAIRKLAYRKRLLLLIAFLDTLMLGVVASAIGAALAVAYIGLKGNSHAGWNKVANAGYDKFIKHTATAIALSIFAVTDLVTLTMHSTYTLYKGVHD
ncbi:CASP-like protein 1D2 [Citrus sinensis]|uniref:CASP-like protein 1D1 n=1 Tax=Citrus sinensis TaxID=2711 RepID=UPI000763ABF6|nr:CASP-like protein 1D1 [Citrus sinensis]KAH9765624.1 CASP-like protein 1D2 [Citrus sinensis]